MKAILFLSFFLVISSSLSAKKIYTISKADFINYYSSSCKRIMIPCQNEDGKMERMYCNKNTVLTLKFKNNEEFELIFHTIKYSDGIIKAVKYNVYYPITKISTFKIDDVESIFINKKNNESLFPYFNFDSVQTRVQKLNDSLRSYFTNRQVNAIYLSSKNDTIKIIEGICYNMIFRDKNETNSGVVKQITKDSIYISNYFDAEESNKSKKDFEIYKYPIIDIAALKVARRNGFTLKKIKLEEYNLNVVNMTFDETFGPCWYALQSTTGNINFYRFCLVENGLAGIAKQDGKIVWEEW